MLKGKLKHLLSLDVLINDDYYNLNIELGTFVKNIKKKVIGVIGSFISLLIR